MGDIFRRETAPHPEPFTGERLTAAIGGQVQIEHYHRYLFARSSVAKLDVLDLGSGEGYGAALLAQVARKVIAIEYSGPTVRTAADNFSRPNLCFVQGDARALPLGDSCIDAVVSFETIEHFDRQDDFLREVRRVLRPDGSFVVSTPDRDVYSPADTAANPYHVRELSRSEFVAILRGSFRHVQIMQQRALIGSALLAETASPAAPLVFDRRGDTHFEACIGLPRAPYLIAVASDRELPPQPASLYIDRGDLDTEALHRMALARELGEAREDLAQATQRAEQATKRADEATQRAESAVQCAEEATQSAEQARRCSEQATQCAQETERRMATLQQEYNELQGSLRTFLRSYLPRLRRRLSGQRP